MEEGRGFFRKVNDLYHLRRSQAIACANDEALKGRRQLDKEVGHVALEQDYRKLKEEARARREYEARQMS